MHLRSVIAENIRALREAKKLKQEELAHLADIHPTYLSGIENARKNITIDLLERIASALQVDESQLVMRGPYARALASVSAVDKG